MVAVPGLITPLRGSECVDLHHAVGVFSCKRDQLALFRDWWFQVPPQGLFLRSLTWMLEDIRPRFGLGLVPLPTLFGSDEIERLFFFGTCAFVDTGGPTLVNDNPLC